jgi:formylglycine-generating enzyme
MLGGMAPLSALILLLAAAPARAGFCKMGMVAVPKDSPRFCIDRFEAMLVEPFEGTEIDFHYAATPNDKTAYKAVSRRGVKPQGYISQVIAAKACKNAGKELCKSADWVEACKGASKTQYPYGAQYQPGVCNEHSGLLKKGLPLSKEDQDPKTRYRSTYGQIFPNDAKMLHMHDPRINEHADGLKATGICASKWGPNDGDWIYDMVGNLHEWTADDAGGMGKFRGGYYNEAELNFSGCDYVTTRHGVAHHDYSTGFRCCAPLEKNP